VNDAGHVGLGKFDAAAVLEFVRHLFFSPGIVGHGAEARR
jgi:hypothetical protein